MRLAYVLPLALCLACGGSGFVEKAQHSLATALVATNQARDVFTAYDLEHQKQIVADANGDAAAAEAAVAAYRAKRAPVLKAFVVAYSSLAAASTALAAVKTQQQKLEVTTLIADAIAATLDVRNALSTLTEKEGS